MSNRFRTFLSSGRGGEGGRGLSSEKLFAQYSIDYILFRLSIQGRGGSRGEGGEGRGRGRGEGTIDIIRRKMIS